MFPFPGVTASTDSRTQPGLGNHCLMIFPVRGRRDRNVRRACAGRRPAARRDLPGAFAARRLAVRRQFRLYAASVPNFCQAAPLRAAHPQIVPRRTTSESSSASRYPGRPPGRGPGGVGVGSPPPAPFDPGLGRQGSRLRFARAAVCQLQHHVFEATSSCSSPARRAQAQQDLAVAGHVTGCAGTVAVIRTTPCPVRLRPPPAGGREGTPVDWTGRTPPDQPAPDRTVAGPAPPGKAEKIPNSSAPAAAADVPPPP